MLKQQYQAGVQAALSKFAATTPGQFLGTQGVAHAQLPIAGGKLRSAGPAHPGRTNMGTSGLNQFATPKPQALTPGASVGQPAMT